MTRQERFDVGERPAVEVEVSSGSVDVRNGPTGVVAVSIGGNEDAWDVARGGDTVTVRPRSRFRGRSGRITIDAPVGTIVEIRTASADINLVGELGPARVRTASGSIRAAGLAELAVATASGDVRVERVGHDSQVTSVSGDLELQRVGGRLTATTASGDVRVGHLSGDAEIGTTSGDVRIDRFDGSAATIRSVSGDVELGLPSGIRVEPDLATVSGRARLPEPTTGTRAEPRRTVRLAVKTVSGDITLSRSR